ncbi:MAG: S9 family peptidase, partial [Clostridia bacterium]|nr:S9 family peptidase [Clostridia bacterium]
GPKAIFGGIFHHEMQCFANMGYFVFFTNPRGADGRGEDFANITGQLGYIDFRDFMEFTDEVLRRYPDIDEKRVGICGGSYGGFMCNWMIGHTDRFAAAASQRSISNYLTKSLCTDIGYNHNMSQLETDPWHDFERVWEHSPLKCAPNAKTPTLFIQSDEDYRCWMSDAIQMYTALKMNGTDARLALFHGESHGLSRIGRPQNRIGRLTEIGSWFEKYLKG